MSEQNQAHFNEDDSNSNANLAFCTFCNGNGKELMNELKLKVATLEAKNQLFEATNKHLEEKLKHFEEKQIQEKKYTELEAKMRNLELMQKMEHLEADFTKKLAILEEQLKGNSDLVTEGNANKAILEKLKALKDAIGKAEENIQKNQQKIGERFKEVVTQNRKQAQDIKEFEEKLKEAEQKAQMANNQLETTIQGIQKKMEDFAAKEKAKADEQSAGGLSFGMRGGSQGYFSGRGRGGFAFREMAKDDELSGGSRGGMRETFGGRGSGSSYFRGRGGFGANTEENKGFGATSKEAEQKEKAQMANNKKKMEDFAAKETAKDDDLFAGGLRGGMRGGFGGRGSSGGFVPIQPVGNKGLGATSKEAEQKEKAQMANNKMETTIQAQGIQKKMEESAANKKANADEQPGGSRGGLQGGFGSGRIRIRLDDKLQRIQKKIVESAKKMANDDEQPGGLSLGMRGGFGGRGDFDGPPVV